MKDHNTKSDFKIEFDAVGGFFDKYEREIDEAPRNSKLGIIRDLDDTLSDILRVVDCKDINLARARDNINHAMLILAEMWINESTEEAELKNLKKKINKLENEIEIWKHKTNELKEYAAHINDGDWESGGF